MCDFVFFKTFYKWQFFTTVKGIFKNTFEFSFEINISIIYSNSPQQLIQNMSETGLGALQTFNMELTVTIINCSHMHANYPILTRRLQDLSICYSHYRYSVKSPGLAIFSSASYTSFLLNQARFPLIIPQLAS